MAIWHCYWHLVVKNGNFTLLLRSSGQEWQFHIATDIYWSRMVISHCYWHLLVKNGNFTLLLTSTGHKWQLARCTPRSASRSTPKCIMGYMLSDVFSSHFGFLKKRWEFSSYLWIIRVVNSQLALYSHVRCNSSSTPPQMTITNFNYEGSYLPGLICNIVVQAHLGRSASRSTPTHTKIHHGYILWDVFGSHFGFFKKRWEFPFISE